MYLQWTKYVGNPEFREAKDCFLFWEACGQTKSFGMVDEDTSF